MAIAGVSTISLGTYQAYEINQLVTTRAAAQRAVVAESLARQIETHMERELRSIEGLAAVLDARGAVEDPDAATDILIEYCNRYLGTQLIVLGTRSGYGIASSDLERSAAGLDYSDRDYFRAVAEHRRSVISRVQIGKRTRVPNIQVAAPLGGTAFRGYVSMSLELGPVVSFAERAVHRLPYGRAVIWDWDGRVVADTRVGRSDHLRLVNGGSIFGVGPEARPELRQGSDEFGESSEGAASLAVVGTNAWTVLVLQPTYVVQREANAAWTRCILITALVLGVGLFLSLLVARWTAGPITELSDAAELVDSNLLDALDFESTVDRFRPKEAVDLSNALRRMMVRLRAHTEHLETLVLERTKELEIARNEALEASSHKSRFIANMSHEIRTPMNGVLGMTELLLERTEDAELREYAEAAHTSGLGLLDLLNDILDFSKIDAGRMSLETEPFDLEAELELIVETFRGVTSKRAVELVLDLDPSTPWSVVGDASRLRQVVGNLVGNAVKFTEHGTVTLKVSGHEVDGEVLLELQVQDTGIGIAPDRLDTIFEAFAQGDSSTTRRFGGTGLGLPIARRLVRMMGGDIEVTSDLGLGTTFTVALRLPTGPHPESPRVRSSLDGEVIVCSARDAIREAMVHQLARVGLSGVPAIDATEVRACIDDAARPVAAVLVDEAGFDAVAELVNGVPLVLWIPVGHVLGSSDARLRTTLTRPCRRTRLVEALENSATGRTRGPAKAKPEAMKGRALAVDDNRVNQRVLERMLQSFGIEVVIASDGREAVERFREGRFDIVLMDCQMPVMDGFEATRAIRELERGDERTPIVALTANASSTDRRACLESGMDEHLPKPITKGDLRRMLEIWLPVAAQSSGGSVSSRSSSHA